MNPELEAFEELKAKLAESEARCDELRERLSFAWTEKEREIEQVEKDVAARERATCQDVVLRLVAEGEEREETFRRVLLTLKGVVMRIQRLGPEVFEEVMASKEEEADGC